ncbi:MAG: hypothetical protein WBX19_14895 [Terracidiphilus sp.]
MPGDRGPIERGGEYDVKVKQGERRNKEIRLVDISKVHRLYALASHESHPDQDHCQQQRK